MSAPAVAEPLVERRRAIPRRQRQQFPGLRDAGEFASLSNQLEDLHVQAIKRLRFRADRSKLAMLLRLAADLLEHGTHG